MRPFSGTAVARYARCPQEWHYHLRDREIEVPSPQMLAGTEIHEQIMNYYKKKEIPANDVARYYVEQVAQKEDNAILASEIELFAPCGPYTLQGRFDLLYRDKQSGALIIRDFKTKGELPKEYSYFPLDWQLKVYQVILHHHYPKEIIFFEHHLIRREVPPGYGDRPMFLEGTDKRGRHYRRKSHGSTWWQDYIQTYRQISVPENIRHYEQELKHLLQKMDSHSIFRSPGPLCNTCSHLETCIRESREGEL